FRLAIESAAQQVFYSKVHRTGTGRQDAEQRWAAANKTTNRLKLAVLDDSEGSLGGWLSYRAERGPTLKLANAGTHGEVVTVDAHAVNDLGRMVDGILAS
ncbi:MAG: recombinase RecF, partial [Rhodococcus sp. (in: high G+C Gram-positive bacteria)]